MVQILNPVDPNLVYTYTVELSATDFRTALESRNYEAIQQFIPDEVEMNDVLEILGIEPDLELELEPEEPESEEITETKKKGLFSSILHGLIEETLNEMEPIQRKYAAKHKRNRLTTIGKIKKSPPYTVNPPKERSQSAPPIGEETNPIEFVAGRKSREQACYDDPNCRALKNKKKVKVYMEPHMHQDTDDGELEEISTMAGGSVEGYSLPLGVTRRKKKKKDTKNEQLVNDILNYLLKSLKP